MRQAREDLLLGGAGPGERDVLADGAVEQEGVLKHHPELRAIGLEPHGGEIDAVHQDLPRGGTWNAATSPMMVDLPEPEGPTSAVTVPGSRVEGDISSTGLPGS